MKPILLVLTLAGTLTAAANNLPTADDVLAQLTRVNDTWQHDHAPHTRAFWDHAAYHTANMEAYRLTGHARWYAYTDTWCRHNHWRGARSDDKSRWAYRTYGEDQEHVLFGDWQICFQTYADMYTLVPAPHKIERALEVMGYQADLPQHDFWWWSDALYMVMPVLTKLYTITGDQRYLDHLTANFRWTDSLLYDTDDHLYYRDAKYIYPRVKTADGGKSFWARGDGWVLAGLAKVLNDMPQDYPDRPFFVQRFSELALAVADCQQPEGYWTRSLLCPEDAPGPETSGTAFFCYGILWGLNHGYLPADTFLPVVQRAWHYLSHTALQPDGTIGYVQPIGEKPDPTRTVDAHSQAPFGTGAWLLAACEMVRYLNHSIAPDAQRLTRSVWRYGRPGPALLRATDKEPLTFTVTNTGNDNRQQVVDLTTTDSLRLLGYGVAREWFITDPDGNELPSQITHDGHVLVLCTLAPHSSLQLLLRQGQPADYVLTANGRLYPQRDDDLAWENDRSAWRLYGPASHRKAPQQPRFGFDTFVKNTPHPIQDQLYQSELTSYGIHAQMQQAGVGQQWNDIHTSFTYHRNHGYGMDDYSVGPTLGAGAPFLLWGDSLVTSPGYYEQATILDNGPLRFSVLLNMPSYTLGTDTIREQRLITQDCATHLASCAITYHGLKQTVTPGAGLALHDEVAVNRIVNRKQGYLLCADGLSHPNTMNGQHYLGVVFPKGLKKAIVSTLGGTEHLLGYAKESLEDSKVQEFKSSRGSIHDAAQVWSGDQKPLSFTFLFASAWSLYDIPTLSLWEQTLQHELSGTLSHTRDAR